MLSLKYIARCVGPPPARGASVLEYLTLLTSRKCRASKNKWHCARARERESDTDAWRLFAITSRGLRTDKITNASSFATDNIILPT